jgi:hypothetical protein
MAPEKRTGKTMAREERQRLLADPRAGRLRRRRLYLFGSTGLHARASRPTGSVLKAKKAEDFVRNVGIDLDKVREVKSDDAINDLAVGDEPGLPWQHTRRGPLLGDNRDGSSRRQAPGRLAALNSGQLIGSKDAGYERIERVGIGQVQE